MGRRPTVGAVVTAHRVRVRRAMAAAVDIALLTTARRTIARPAAGDTRQRLRSMAVAAASTAVAEVDTAAAADTAVDVTKAKVS